MTSPVKLSRRTLMFVAAATGAGCATAAPPQASPSPPELAEPLRPLSRMIGQWRGQGRGEPGEAEVERSYTPILGGRFIEVRNRSRYAPQTDNPAGEVHEDLGYFSFDDARSRFVLRQFHVEGFVAEYASASDGFDGGSLVMESEAIENIGAGWRARESYRFSSDDEFEEVFELAPPDEDFALYSRSTLTRV